MMFGVNGFHKSLKKLFLTVYYGDNSSLDIMCTLDGILRLKSAIGDYFTISNDEDELRFNSFVGDLGYETKFGFNKLGLEIYSSNFIVNISEKDLFDFFNEITGFQRTMFVNFTDEEMIIISEKYENIHEFRNDANKVIKQSLLD